MLLLDNGGEYNAIINSYCTGIEPGIEGGQNTWGSCRGLGSNQSYQLWW